MNRRDIDWDNPYRAPETTFDPEQNRPRPQTGFFGVKLFLALQVATTLVGLALSQYDVETIIGSGPVLATVGMVLAVLSFRKRVGFAGWLGISAPAFCVLVFLTIFLQNWSPADAQKPVPLMGLTYLAATGVVSFVVLKQIQSRERIMQTSLQPGSF